jgi:hypothetical protein
MSSLRKIITVRQEQRYTNSMFSVILFWCCFSTSSRKLITKVRNVLEAQSPRSHQRHSTAIPSSGPTETINIRTDARQFESFLRSINRCSSLLDARRLKNDIMGEIRRTRVLLGRCNNIQRFTTEVISFRQPITKMRIGSTAKRQRMLWHFLTDSIRPNGKSSKGLLF